MTERLSGIALRRYVWERTTGLNATSIDIPVLLGLAVLEELCSEEAAKEYLSYFNDTVHRNIDRASGGMPGNNG